VTIQKKADFAQQGLAITGEIELLPENILGMCKNSLS
jgi:hypothetical protein